MPHYTALPLIKQRKSEKRVRKPVFEVGSSVVQRGIIVIIKPQMRFLWFMVHLFHDKCESVTITKGPTRAERLLSSQT